MSKQPVQKTAKERLESKYEDLVTGIKIWDYEPDDAVFTKGFGLPIRPHASPKSTPKTRSPLELLRDYSNAWAEHGVACPDLVFQTRSQGQHFYASCLAGSGVYSITGHTPDSVNGMCIVRVMGVNLIWPEA